MNIEKYELELTKLDMSYYVLSSAKKVQTLHHFKEQIEKFNERFPDRTLSIEVTKIVIDSPNREDGELGWFLQCFGGSPWKKEPNPYGNGIDYIRTVPFPLHSSYIKTFNFVAEAVNPPPSCKIETYEEEVPAHKITKTRVTCKEGVVDEEPLPQESAVAATPVTDDEGPL